jgi:hypothetical protein
LHDPVSNTSGMDDSSLVNLWSIQVEGASHPIYLLNINELLLSNSAFYPIIPIQPAYFRFTHKLYYYEIIFNNIDMYLTLNIMETTKKRANFNHLLISFFEKVRNVLRPQEEDEKSLEWRRPKRAEQF